MCQCLFAQFYFRTSVSTNKCYGRGSAMSVAGEWGADGAERWTSESSSNDKHLSVISVKFQSWREETAYKRAMLILVWERETGSSCTYPEKKWLLKAVSSGKSGSINCSLSTQWSCFQRKEDYYVWIQKAVSSGKSNLLILICFCCLFDIFS